MMPPRRSGMKQTWIKRSRWLVPLAILATFAAVMLVRFQQRTLSPENFQVSQRGREFHPGIINVKQGDVVRINNDDDDLSHHAYVAAERFRFDSGDQEPGRSVDITFTVPGTFNVLCGIHPKMRLNVNVQ